MKYKKANSVICSHVRLFHVVAFKLVEMLYLFDVRQKKS